MTVGLDNRGNVTDFKSVVDAKNKVIQFTGPLDVTVHPVTNRIYVADFGRQASFASEGSVECFNPVNWGTAS